MFRRPLAAGLSLVVALSPLGPAVPVVLAENAAPSLAAAAAAGAGDAVRLGAWNAFALDCAASPQGLALTRLLRLDFSANLGEANRFAAVMANTALEPAALEGLTAERRYVALQAAVTPYAEDVLRKYDAASAPRSAGGAPAEDASGLLGELDRLRTVSGLLPEGYAPRIEHAYAVLEPLQPEQAQARLSGMRAALEKAWSPRPEAGPAVAAAIAPSVRPAPGADGRVERMREEAAPPLSSRRGEAEGSGAGKGWGRDVPLPENSNPTGIAVEPIDAASAARASPELKAFLAKSEIKPIDAGLHPELGLFQKQLAAMLRRLTTPEDVKDGVRAIHVVIVDDMDVNAFFTKLSPAERVLGVTLGTLRFLENDDELAFMLGHELQHGPSELQAYVNRPQSDDQGRLFARFMQRAVENEVDVKSLLRRVQAKGYNPHGAAHVLRRFLERFGEGAGATHTSSASRRDTVDLALAALRRGAGEKVAEDVPSAYSRAILGPLQDRWLRTPAFEALQRRRIAEVLKLEPNPGTGVYRAFREALGHPLFPLSFMYYNGHFEILSRELRRLGEGLINDEEWIDLQLDLHRRLDEAFEQARRAELSGAPELKSLEQVEGLLNVDSRVYSVRTGSRSDIRELWSAVKRKQDELDVLERRMKTAEERSLARASRQELGSLRLELYVAQQLYESSSDLDAAIIAAVWERVFNERAIDRGEHQHLRRDKWEALQARRKVLPPLEARNERRRQETVERSLDLILAAFHSKDPFSGIRANIDDPIERFLSLPDELQRRNAQRAFREYLKTAEGYATRPGEMFPEQAFVHWNDGADKPIRRLFSIYREVEPAAALSDFQGFYALLIKQCRSSEALDTLFPRNDPAFAKQVLTAGLVEALADRYLELLEKESRTAPLKDWLRQLDSLQPRLDALGISVARIPARRLLQGPIAAVLGRVQREYGRLFGRPLTREQAKSLFYASHPELYAKVAEQETLTHDRLKAELRALAALPCAKPLIPFFDLALSWPNRDFEFFYDIAPLLDFDATRTSHDYEARLTRVLKEARSFLDFLMWRHPERFDLVLTLLTPHSYRGELDAGSREELDRLRERLLRERFMDRLSPHLRAGPAAAMERAAYELWSELPSVWNGSDGWYIGQVVAPYFSAHVPEASSGLERLIGYLAAIRRLEKEEEGGRRDDRRCTIRFDKQWISAAASPEALAAAKPEILAEALVSLLDYSGPDPRIDAVFDRFWERTESSPDVRLALLDGQWVGKLYYDENRRRLARWQLNRKFRVDEAAQALRARRVESPAKKKLVRPTIVAIAAELELQFPQSSALKNEMLAYVQDALLSNPVETAYLGQKKLRLENWYQSRQLAFLDVPQAASRFMESAFDRLEMIRYLIGIQEDAPAFLERSAASHKEALKAILEALPVAKRHFAEADMLTRTYALQPLLDSQRGVLGEAEASAALMNMILGEQADNPIARRLFESYLESVSASERKVMLGYVLGSFVGGAKRGASLKSILESMGPFGIKAGQFLRTSGLVPPNLRRELDDFLSRALPPQREEVVARLREVFGASLSRVHAIEELAGSGSINYVVTCVLRNPETGANERVVVRFLRENAEGQIANENAVWEKTIAKLTSGEDPEERRLGRILSETRRHTMETLGPGGAELDLESERALYPLASEAYASPAEARSGYAIEVGEPLPAFQKLVPAALAKKVSIYRHVPSVPLDALPAAERPKVAARIAAAEFRALLRLGTFDGDGHPGNWLIDPARKVLTRIDYAQARRLTAEELSSLRETLRAMLRPRLDAGAARVVARRFKDMFEAEGRPDDLEAVVREALARPDFPEFLAPHERLFFLREAVERHYHARGRPDVLIRLKPVLRAALASLGRTQIYREQLSDAAYLDLLLDALDMSPTVMRARLALERVAAPLRRLAARLAR